MGIRSCGFIQMLSDSVLINVDLCMFMETSFQRLRLMNYCFEILKGLIQTVQY